MSARLGRLVACRWFCWICGTWVDDSRTRCPVKH